MSIQTSLASWPSAFRHAADQLLRRWRGRHDARRTISTLHDLSDTQLKDVGVKRHEIETRFSW